MPKYLDHHKVVNMPPEAAQQIVADIKAKRPNKFGAIPFNAFMAKGEMWCYGEAPNPEAVHKSHEGYGVKLGSGDVVEVTSLV